MVPKYKTVVVDYEAMQSCLDLHAEQGWRLMSVTPDAWRRVMNSHGITVQSMGVKTSDAPEEELIASYYLLVFMREDDNRYELGRASASEERPDRSFTLPDY